MKKAVMVFHNLQIISEALEARSLRRIRFHIFMVGQVTVSGQAKPRSTA